MLNKHYVEFAGYLDHWNGFNSQYELPRNMSIVQVGEFLLQKCEEDKFNVNWYRTYDQEVSLIEQGEKLGEKTNFSDIYYINEGNIISCETRTLIRKLENLRKQLEGAWKDLTN
ncbi:MAG: hypothetical protein ABIB79_05025 [archaeon]